MALPTLPIQLEPPQIEELARHFSAFRHDVNGCLALVVAATELIRYNPDVVKRMATTLIEQPPKIAGKIREFVQECERTLGIRPDTDSWYRDMWKRHNAAPGEPGSPVTISPDAVKTLHNELLQLGKEITALGIVVSGTSALASAHPMSCDEVGLTAAEQLPKLTKKFERVADLLEKTLEVRVSAPTRLASGTATGPVVLSPDEVALFHRRLTNLQRDLSEHLGPLLELSRLARREPGQVQARAGEFAEQPPRISADVQRFSVDFDRTFGISRAS